MEKLFYELIQVSTGQLDCLSRGPEPEEWQELHEMARHQHMIGICYHGVKQLFEFGLRVPQDLVIDWMAEAETVQESNLVMDQRSVKVLQMMAEQNIRASILMGQGIARDYGELRSLRYPDHIDICTDSSLERLLEVANPINDGYSDSDYRLVHLNQWNDVDVRLHYEIGIGKNPLKNKRIRQWLKKNQELLFVKDGDMVRPSVRLNVILVLIEIYWKFLYQRITLREMTDYFFTLRKVAASGKKGVDYEKILRKIGLLSFAQGVMWVMQEVYGLKEEALVTMPSEHQGSFILKDILAGKHHILHLLMRYPMELLFSRF
ncbi:MAG: nucleotidyltransferase family protein [Prevotella sp.]|nr:nucleotidyltransferase family protein [Prevotella sp.]